MHANIKKVEKYWTKLILSLSHDDKLQYKELSRTCIEEFFMILEAETELIEERNENLK